MSNTSSYRWSGSKYFSLLVSSDSKIKILVNNIMSMVEKFDLDGVNLDWGNMKIIDMSHQNLKLLKFNT